RIVRVTAFRHDERHRRLLLVAVRALALLDPNLSLWGGRGGLRSFRRHRDSCDETVHLMRRIRFVMLHLRRAQHAVLCVERDEIRHMNRVVTMKYPIAGTIGLPANLDGLEGA